ncbi:phage tail tube protein [Immundisolibacter sp.]
MPIATGVFKKLSYKKQADLTTKASGSGAKYLRRVTSTLDLKKNTYESAEIRPSMMKADMRHGMRMVDGSINGELSVGTYADFMASVLRSTWATASTSGSLTNVTAAVTTAPNGTFTRAAGDWLAAGFKVGDVVRCTGWTTPATANNGHNFMITALSATVMTVTPLDGAPLVAKASGDSVTITAAGKKAQVPTSNHVRDYYTIEHWYSDVLLSEQFKGCVIDGMNIKLPATGMATIDFPVKGIDMDTSASTEYFTTPSAASSGAVLAAVNGAVYVAGTKVGYITGMDFKVAGNHKTPDGIVGSNVAPDIFPGVIGVDGTMSVLFTDATMRDYFISEAEVSVVAAFVGGNTPAADFIAFAMPRVKLGSAEKDDGEKGLTMTVKFTALENTEGGTGTNTANSVITIMDSIVS